MSAPVPETIAAVDLGSNSFHMIVAQADAGRLHVVDRMKEMVRLAAGLDERDRLRGDAVTRALECLRRFGQRLKGLQPDNVRVVGTNTLRKAENSADFIGQAETALGHRIDVISGLEEARLIYLGVSHSLEDDSRKRLVIDIGGGSTEAILGQRFKPAHMESLHIGCVGLSARFFGDGIIDEARLEAAEIAALQELEPHQERFRRIGWESAIGASGTVQAIRDVVSNAGWSQDGITGDALVRLRKAIIAAKHVNHLDLPGLQPERAPVFPGGVAILSAAFEALAIDRMRVADGALREGLLYDLLGRIHQEDVRERTVEDLATRYRIDVEHAARVEGTALKLLKQVAAAWGLDHATHARALRWAARLHEIGLAINHSQHQKHGGYLLNNLDMPGFARGDQQLLAALVRCHRRKLPVEELMNLPEHLRVSARHLYLLLRLAVVLHRSRTSARLPALGAEPGVDSLRLRLPEGWLDTHPLTRADLDQEAEYLKAAGFRLKAK